jgi:hypothetical protein
MTSFIKLTLVGNGGVGKLNAIFYLIKMAGLFQNLFKSSSKYPKYVWKNIAKLGNFFTAAYYLYTYTNLI